jgi:putative membrane protein
MSAVIAFLHHLAAFTLVSALAIEFILIRSELTAANARIIQLADLTFGASAGAILIIGLLRVFYFEKGAAYYFHSVPFIVKLSLFVVIGLLSIYPTVQFLSWRPAVKQGSAPGVEPAKLRTIRRIIHWEIAGVVVLILCAALMARGIGVLRP